MIQLFKNPEILDCDLCFELYDAECPKHKLLIAFRDDPYLERCVNLLIEQKLAVERDKTSTPPKWMFWKTRQA